MNLRSLAPFIMLVGIFGTGTTVASPIGLLDLETVADKADAVVVATVTQQSQSGSLVSFVLSVNRVLKGNVAPKQLISAQWTSLTGDLREGNIKGVQALWFLNGNSMATFWQIIPTLAGAAPLGLVILPAGATIVSADFQYTSGTPVNEKLFLELLNGIEERGGSSLILFPERLDSFDHMASAAIRKVYTRWSSGTQQQLQAIGMRGLIRQGDTTTLASVERQFQSLGTQPDASASIANAICSYNNANPIGIPILGRLAASISPIPRLQRCAAEALRNIHSKETLPFLVPLLESTDVTIRYFGLSGLASFANTGYIPWEPPLQLDSVQAPRTPSGFVNQDTLNNFPAMSAFAQNETQYLTFWKIWWTKNQIALGH